MAADLLAIAPELRGHYIAAVVTHYNESASKDMIAGYSNRCVIAADWCIAAPTGIEAPTFSHYEDEDGVEYRIPYSRGIFKYKNPKYDHMDSYFDPEKRDYRDTLDTRALRKIGKPFKRMGKCRGSQFSRCCQPGR